MISCKRSHICYCRITVYLSLQINGEYKFDVENSKLKSLDKWLDYSELLFEVNVTEAITGLRQNATGTVRFYPFENKVEFLQSLPKSFKPGLQYKVLVRFSFRIKLLRFRIIRHLHLCLKIIWMYMYMLLKWLGFRIIDKLLFYV